MKKRNKILLITGIVIFVGVSLTLLRLRKLEKDKNKPAELAMVETGPKKLSGMTSEEKKSHLRAFIGGYGGVSHSKCAAALKREVAGRFKYPDEVDFDNSYKLIDSGEIISVDSCTIKVKGTGVAPNAFGVKGKFWFIASIKLLDDSEKIEAVEIFE